MSESAFSETVMIRNAEGMHLRPADAFVTMAKQFEATIELVKDGEPVDGKSILQLMTLAAARGDQVVIHAKGGDAQKAVESLAELVRRGFDLDDPSAPKS